MSLCFWSSGQCVCFLLQRSEFEYRWSLQIVYERTKINKIEACVGPFVKHSVAANLVLRCFGKVDILLFEYFEQITWRVFVQSRTNGIGFSRLQSAAIPRLKQEEEGEKNPSAAARLALADLGPKVRRWTDWNVISWWRRLELRNAVS